MTDVAMLIDEAVGNVAGLKFPAPRFVPVPSDASAHVTSNGDGYSCPDLRRAAECVPFCEAEDRDEAAVDHGKDDDSRPASKGPRQRRGGHHGYGKPFAKGEDPCRDLRAGRRSCLPARSSSRCAGWWGRTASSSASCSLGAADRRVSGSI